MKTLAIAVLLSFAVIFTCGAHRAPIPPDVLMKLKAMHYHNDIHTIGLRIVPMPNVSNVQTRPTTSHSRVAISGFFGQPGGSGRSHHSSRTGHDMSVGFDGFGGGSSGNNGGGVELITDPKQASNSCEQREICVPVPVDDQDASTFIFPQCIELPQCLGSCCDSFQRCHARHVVPVMVAVTKWQYDNGELREVNKTFVQMAKHMDCGCEKCKENSVVCKENQVRKECACHCANEQEAANCNSPWKWSNDKCTCECTIDRCVAGESLNRTACKCFPAFTASRSVPKSQSTDIRRAPEVVQGNVDGLPQVKMSRKNDRTAHIFH